MHFQKEEPRRNGWPVVVCWLAMSASLVCLFVCAPRFVSFSIRCKHNRDYHCELCVREYLALWCALHWSICGLPAAEAVMADEAPRTRHKTNCGETRITDRAL